MPRIRRGGPLPLETAAAAAPRIRRGGLLPLAEATAAAPRVRRDGPQPLENVAAAAPRLRRDGPLPLEDVTAIARRPRAPSGSCDFGVALLGTWGCRPYFLGIVLCWAPGWEPFHALGCAVISHGQRRC